MICSLVIQIKPQQLVNVNQLLQAINGVEIHSQNEQGKLAVTIEHPSREYCSKVMTDMTHIEGVMSASLVFEYQEDLDSEQVKV